MPCASAFVTITWCGIYGDVVVRVNPGFLLAMHIDTDEGNAANIRTGMIGYIEEIQQRH